MADNDERGGSETLIRLSPPSRSITRSRPDSIVSPKPAARLCRCRHHRSCPVSSLSHLDTLSSLRSLIISTPPQLPSFFTLSSRHSVQFEIVDYIDTTTSVQFDYIDTDSEHNTDMVTRMFLAPPLLLYSAHPFDLTISSIRNNFLRSFDLLRYPETERETNAVRCPTHQNYRIRRLTVPIDPR
ncbi:hypothetical protein ACFX13_003824 [Malus domestica]